MRERGWSYSTVAQRSGLPRSTVHHIASADGARRPSRPATLEALASGLELPIAVVRAAAAEAAGLRVDPVAIDADTAVIIAGLEELTPEERRHVAALVESLRTQARRPSP
jgi:hypothetical protein